MEKADEILQQFGLADSDAPVTPAVGAPSTSSDILVGKRYGETKMDEVTDSQASRLMEAVGVVSEEKAEPQREEGTKGRSSGRTTKRRRKAKQQTEEPEPMELSSSEAEEDRAEKEEEKVNGESKQWKPVNPRVENLGTTVGNLGTTQAPTRGRSLRKRKKLRRESKSFDAFLNEVFKNV
jgi:hypothetical protein